MEWWIEALGTRYMYAVAARQISTCTYGHTVGGVVSRLSDTDSINCQLLRLIKTWLPGWQGHESTTTTINVAVMPCSPSLASTS